MQTPEWLDSKEIIRRAFDRFKHYGDYSKELVISDDFIENLVVEIESEDTSEVIVIAAKIMCRIIKTRPISVNSDVLALQDNYKQANERFAFDLGVALVGIDALQIDENNQAAKRLIECLYSHDCQEADLRFWLNELRDSVLGK